MTHAWSLRRRLAVPVLAAATVLGSMAGCATAISGVAAPAGPGMSARSGGGDPTTAATRAAGTDTSTDTPSRPGPTTTVTDRTVAPSGRDTGTVTPPVAGESVDPAQFARIVEQGMSDITSMTFRLTIKAAGQTIRITGAQTVENGTVTAARMKFGGPKTVEFLLVDGKAFLGGDASVLKALGVNDPKAEWVVAEKDSSNKALATIAAQLETSLDQTGPESYVALATSLKSVTRTGERTVGGVTGTGYVAILDVDAFAGTSAANKQSAAAMKAAGIDELTMPIQLDDKNRIRQFTQEFEISGQKVSNEFVVSDYNTPVTIKAPDPATVSNGN